MTTAILQRLKTEALTLPEDERAELARNLIESLDSPADGDVTAEWNREISRRIAEIDSGTAKFIDRAELRRRMEQRITKT